MKKREIFNRVIAWFLLLTLLGSCTMYHLRTSHLSEKSRQAVKPTPTRIVIHVGDTYKELVNAVKVDNTLQGTLQPLNETSEIYYKLAQRKNNFKARSRDKEFIKQIHLFVEKTVEENGLTIIDLNDIQQIQKLEVNAGLSVVLYTLSGVGVFIGAFFTALLIACNCPHVYTHNGNSYNYSNTLYTGAIHKKIERYDYKVLPDYNPKNDTYKIQLKNEEDENQYTNFMDLIAISHDDSFEVASDQRGKFYSLSDVKPPLRAIDDNGNSLKSLLEERDDAGFAFDSYGKDDYSSLTARFEKPKNVKQAKLIMRVKNNPWGGFVYKEFTQLFGDFYDNWSRKTGKKSAKHMEDNFKKGGVVLVVSIKQNNEWKDLESINLVGDVNYNSIVVPISTKDLNGDDITIRIRSGFKFWEIDYLGIDFSDEKTFKVEHISPTITSDSKLTNQAALLKDDDSYFLQTKNSEPVSIVFNNIPNSASARTLILCSKGYYVSQRKVTGKTQFAKLRKLNQQSGLSTYSKELFDFYNETFTFLPNPK